MKESVLTVKVECNQDFIYIQLIRKRVWMKGRQIERKRKKEVTRNEKKYKQSNSKHFSGWHCNTF